MNLKLGKLPFEPSPKDFKLKNFSVALPPLPKTKFGYGTMFADWGMLGNDRYGDCVFAGADHEHMLFNKLAKHPVEFSTASALADYSAVTGFDPKDPNTDQGTMVRDAMDYRRTTGLVASDGSRHKIDAFVQIDPKDFELMLRCVFTFGVVGIGFDFPDTAFNQFNAGAPWDVAPNATIEGGHYVPIVGTTDPAKFATCVTWGDRQLMTKAFYEKYNDEAWVPLTKESLLPATNIRHIDWDTLNQSLNSL